MPQTPNRATPTGIVADPNVFAAHFLAGCKADGVPPSSYQSHLRNAWLAHREFVEWVASGEDAEWIEGLRAKERAEQERVEATARADREAAEKRKRDAADAFGKRQPTAATI